MQYRFILLFIPFFAISACSSTDDSAPAVPSVTTTTTETATTQKPASKQVSPSNPFSTQINALESAKQVSGVANETINKQQQELDFNNR